jgi:hypothetical protein
MISNAQGAISLTHDQCPRLWSKLSNNALVSTKLYKFIKVVEITHAQVLGVVWRMKKH